MQILKKISSYIAHQVVNNATANAMESNFMSGQVLAALLRNNINNIKSINEAEFRVFSQWGDDGIIQFLVNSIPGLPQTFVEFGVETYVEANTRFLMMNNNWSGLVMDGTKSNIDFIKSDNIYWRHNLSARHAFITVENINQLLTEEGFTGKIGILHIDIDGNDYWVWKAINAIDPAIVIVEYNAVYGPDAAVTIPYQADFYRTKAHYSNLYWGCSCKALEMLGAEKGYTFVGTNLNGNNTYFVKNEFMKHFNLDPAKIKYNNSRFRESRDESGKLTYVKDGERLKMIKDCKVYDLKQQKEVSISNVL